MASNRIVLTLGVTAGVCLVVLLHLRRKRARKDDSKARKGWKSKSLSALSAWDEPLEPDAFECLMPLSTAEELHQGLGDARFRAFQKALLVPPAWSYFRLNFLPAADVEPLGFSDSDAARALELRVAAAQEELESNLRATGWHLGTGEANPPPPPPPPPFPPSPLAVPLPSSRLVMRHPLLPDVLMVRSKPKTGNSRLSLLEQGGDDDSGTYSDSKNGGGVGVGGVGGGTAPPLRKVVILDRLCGEAVLKGADVFARGVLTCSSDLFQGDEHVELWCDLGDFRKGSGGGGGGGESAPWSTNGSAGVSGGGGGGGGAGGSGADTGAVQGKARERVEDRALREAQKAKERAQSKKAGKSQKQQAQKRKQQQQGGETTTGAGAATCCGVGFDDDGDDAGGGDGVGGQTGFGNVGVLHGSALHAYRGRRLRLGFGVAHMGRSELLKAQGGLALKVTHRVHVPSAPPLNGLVTSRVYGQGLPSAVVAHVLGPNPHERVIDLCAAPGGKTTHLASLMRCKGELFALDHSKKKVATLNALLTSLGYPSSFVKAVHLDAARAVANTSDKDSKAQAKNGETQQPQDKQQQDKQQDKQKASATSDDATTSSGSSSGSNSGSNSGKGNDDDASTAKAENEKAAATTATTEAKKGSACKGGGRALGGRALRVAAALAKGRTTTKMERVQLQAKSAAAAKAAALKTTATTTNCEEGVATSANTDTAEAAEADAAALAAAAAAACYARGFEAESFDAVLLDPPCSALGLRPRLRIDFTPSDLHEMVQAQRRLMWPAVRLLKPRGRLVFSTCTVNPKENEGQVRYLLDTFPCLRLADAGVSASTGKNIRVGDVGLPNDVGNVPSVFGERGGLSDAERQLVQRFHSQSEGVDGDGVDLADSDTPGFFIAKFVKVESMLQPAAP